MRQGEAGEGSKVQGKRVSIQKGVRGELRREPRGPSSRSTGCVTLGESCTPWGLIVLTAGGGHCWLRWGSFSFGFLNMKTVG